MLITNIPVRKRMRRHAEEGNLNKLSLTRLLHKTIFMARRMDIRDQIKRRIRFIARRMDIRELSPYNCVKW